jgi:hypothetical protein
LQRRRPQHVKVYPHAHRNEEQSQKQALERLDIGFQFAPVFAFCQQHTGQEGAQCHGQTHALHQSGNTNHQQQRGGSEDFGCLAVGNPAQQRSQREPTTDHDGSNDRYYFDSFICNIDEG